MATERRQRMKILQVSSATHIGGGELHVADLARALTERGHEVHLAIRPQSPLLRMLASTQAHFHTMPLRNSLDLSSAYQLSRLIRTYEIDIIHGHAARDYLVCAIAQRLAARGQLVLTRHHYLPIKANPVYRRLFRTAGRVIAVSEFVRSSLLQRFKLPEDQIVTIPNWLKPEAYKVLPDRQQARARLGLHRPLVVGMIGEITPAKGQEEFIRAAAALAHQRDDVEFLIVGDEHNERRSFTQRLQQIAREADLADRVNFVSRVDDVRWAFAALDVFVLPSWNEAFSIVLIQAMAAGVPVIASQIGGPAEIVTDGVTGLLAPPRQVDALAEKIQQLLDDKDLRARLVTAARQHVEHRFEREKVIDQIETLYRSLVVGR
jgi:glycosyltransferase involved in cell wall biosynthesis